ncbi:hypothetical protein VTK73DRAFT_3092 [Phialemonium thermophilum]|uniref:VOC domain-containing protein n=1 Tax=Phialemonium thermophilum TaxID=223376 RepID=A0ABR3X0L2_9PEZI
MSDWKPPSFGSPCWLSISATDVARAHKFYSTVFDWKFKPESKEYPGSSIRMFDFGPDLKLTGGILRVPDETGVLKTGHGGVSLHLIVDDLERSANAIIEAGGKILSKPKPEGKFGLYQYFEDTEGNLGSIYQVVAGGSHE